jgi:phosphate transport system substrate-binding protein
MKTTLKKIASTLLVSALAFGPALQAFADTVLNGAGATFPYPIYSKWFDEYNKVHPDIKINYQSIGSGGGVKQFTSKTVDFGATDGPMSDKELFAVDGKSLHVPTVLGGVVPTWNLPGVEELKFSGDLLASIFIGKVKNWSDPAIKALNPEANLPDMPITVVHRADGSGTTYCWTDYLAKVSPEWKSKVGMGKSVNWPAGLGGKGNEGVAGLVKQTKGAFGYVELIYAKENSMPYGAVKNKSGKFVKASSESISAAAAGVKMPKDFRVSITDANGDETYPISTFTWLLVYQSNPAGRGKTIKDFLTWMLDEGQKIAPTLGYAPLPAEVKDMVAQAITTIR